MFFSEASRAVPPRQYPHDAKKDHELPGCYMPRNEAINGSTSWEPVKDEQLFRFLHDRYNGQYEDQMTGTLAAEILKDGSILLELTDRIAEFSFYNLPRAKEDFMYIPRTPTAGWLNFYDRAGQSIRCGGSSYDLKKDIFPAFKCRMTIDSEGAVHFFGDRSAATRAKAEESTDADAASKDFHWRKISEIAGTAEAYSNNNIRRDSNGRESFHLQIFGAAAETLYAKLNATEGTTFWGPQHPVKIKYGKQVWRLTSPTGQKTQNAESFLALMGPQQHPQRNDCFRKCHASVAATSCWPNHREHLCCVERSAPQACVRTPNNAITGGVRRPSTVLARRYEFGQQQPGRGLRVGLRVYY